MATEAWRLEQLADEELVRQARSGCRDAVELLLRRYRGVVEGKARAYYLPGADREDVVQEGMIGLFKAIRDFSLARRTSFRSFAELCVTRHLVSAVKAASRCKHEPLNRSVRLDEIVDEEGREGVGDTLPCPPSDEPERVVIVRWVLREVMEVARRELSALERRALLGYIKGDSYRDAARRAGCRVKQVDNALQRAKKKIARRLGAVI